MKKSLALLLAAVMMLSMFSFAEEDFDAPYDPAINLTAWRFLSSVIQFENGDDIEHNIFIDRFASDLGINLTYDWVVAEEQFDQKVALSIASDEYSDIMWLNAKQFKELAEAGKLYDLTELFETYANDYAKEVLCSDMVQFESAMFDGKLYALPHTASSFDRFVVMFIRTDWLEKLGLEAPTTMDELEEVIEAFVTMDPDGNGIDDTFGVSMQKDFYLYGHSTALALFNGYHAYPQSWVKLDDGTLAYGSVQPEVREALLKLQEWYANGWIDPEFAVKDKAKAKEIVSSGKVGIVLGTMSSAGAHLDASVANDPNCDWVAYPIISCDDEPAAPITKMPVIRYYAVSADCEHPEAIIKLLNWNHQAPAGTEYDKSLTVNENNIAVWQYNVIMDENPGKNLNAFKHIRTATETGDPSNLNAEELGYYNRILTWRNDKNADGWTQERIFGEKSSFAVIEQYVDAQNYVVDQFYGSPTEAMGKYQSTLQAMEAEVFTKIVMGEDISAFDKFVEDYYALGGAEITDEVNEWYNSVR